MIGTFGPIDWRAYYKRPALPDPLKDIPCMGCHMYQDGQCARKATPGTSNSCKSWDQWFSKWWAILTGRA